MTVAVISDAKRCLASAVVYIVVRPAEIIVRKKGIFAMRERDLIFKLLRPDR